MITSILGISGMTIVKNKSTPVSTQDTIDYPRILSATGNQATITIHSEQADKLRTILVELHSEQAENTLSSED